MWNLKYGTNEPTYKRETGHMTFKITLSLNLTDTLISVWGAVIPHDFPDFLDSFLLVQIILHAHGISLIIFGIFLVEFGLSTFISLTIHVPDFPYLLGPCTRLSLHVHLPAALLHLLGYNLYLLPHLSNLPIFSPQPLSFATFLK